ncbi:hypothetical protein GCM10009846_26960 [Agrococcus versicolor]|uniref:DUF7882 domain-containing protein n=1 Tax=Agrococcus versicolor TaxID=501482 RepID=A0ABP5MMK2_9MICO
MGTLHYGTASFELDDDALRHFTVVMVTKMRRKEPFLVRVRSDDAARERLWLRCAADVVIRTSGAGAGLEPARLEHMMHEANHAEGVDLCAPWRTRQRVGRR